MAYDLPTVPDDKTNFFRTRLLREVSNFFKWEGLEELGVPVDHIEHELITRGRLMFFSDEDFGYLLLPGSFHGYNIYRERLIGRPVTPTGTDFSFKEKTIIYNYNQKAITDLTQACVLLDNMRGGESLITIIDFYAVRMAMVWQSFDTNLLWQNLPVIISVENENVRLSIEKLLENVWAGKPLVVKDTMLKLTEDTVRFGVADVNMILKELFDAYQELYNDFKALVGIQSSAVDKQSGVSESETSSNNQHIQTALQVMLSQRQKFCTLVNSIYNLNLSVSYQGEGGQEHGKSDNRTMQRIEYSDI